MFLVAGVSQRISLGRRKLIQPGPTVHLLGDNRAVKFPLIVPKAPSGSNLFLTVYSSSLCASIGRAACSSRRAVVSSSVCSS